MGRRHKKLELERDLIDLTLSDDEIESEIEIEIGRKREYENEKEIQIKLYESTPFDPPLNISGNILESRHYKILKSHSAWFTDDIINAFFCILHAKNADKCFVFSSFFYNSLLGKGKEYCLKNWTKGIKPFLFLSGSIEHKIVLFPINSGGSHWVLVAWLVYEGTLNYYDSLMCKRSGKLIMERMTEFFNDMINYDKGDGDGEEDIDKLLSKLSINNSRVPLIKNNFIPKGQIQQTDGSSCGPFCCLNGKNLLLEKKDLVDIDIYEFRENLIKYFKGNALN
jgi:Ulp1 family protease